MSFQIFFAIYFFYQLIEDAFAVKIDAHLLTAYDAFLLCFSNVERIDIKQWNAIKEREDKNDFFKCQKKGIKQKQQHHCLTMEKRQFQQKNNGEKALKLRDIFWLLKTKIGYDFSVWMNHKPIVT